MDIKLPEIVSIGIYNSQIAVKNRTVTRNRKTTMFEIEIPMESGGISYIDDQQMTIEPNMVICAKPGQLRHTRLPFKCYYIHIIVKEGALYELLLDLPDFLVTEKYHQYREIYQKLCQYYDSARENDELILQGLILELIHALHQEAGKQVFRERAKRSSLKTIENVIGYIKENLTSDLSLNAVAAYAGFSPIHFHNSFKAATGKTLHEYVEEQRIKKAANLLIETNHTLTQIAYECGFSSQSYFSYVFKRRMKLTPREYAREVFGQYEAR